METKIKRTTESCVEDSNKHYDSNYTDYLGQYSALTELRRTRYFRPHVPEGCDLLDFGCGPGDVVSGLPASRRCGVEISSTSREIANEKGIDVRASLEDFRGEKFDRIISSHALEHVVDPAQILVSIRELLAPGGRFIILLPINEWSERRQRKWDPNDINQHLFTWTPLLLGNFLTVCGYRPISVTTVHQCYPPKIGRALAAIHPWLFLAAGAAASRLLPKRQVLAVAESA